MARPAAARRALDGGWPPHRFMRAFFGQH